MSNSALRSFPARVLRENVVENGCRFYNDVRPLDSRVAGIVSGLKCMFLPNSVLQQWKRTDLAGFGPLPLLLAIVDASQ